MTTDRPCNLVLVGNPKVCQASDLHRISGYVTERAPRVRTLVWVDGQYRLQRWLAATRPTMVFSPVPLEHLRPIRGRVFAGRSLSKSQEYAALTTAGIRVPRYALLTEADPRPDVSALGKYVVVKPDHGRRGANVRIVRDSRARWEPAGGGDDAGPLLAQEFVYTGQWPVSYRVTTLFGEVLWALKIEADRSRVPLPGPEAFGQTPGLTVVSNSKGCVMSLMNDQRVIRFAESAHRAFPDIPLLGVDVVRREPDGELFVVEVNASGWVWHFSSPLGLKAQAQFGFKFEDQFDGLRKAARILAEQATRYAV